MSRISNLTHQVKRTFLMYVISYSALLALLLAFSMLAESFDISIAYFTRDPAITLYGHPLVGIISNIGIVFWCFTAAICLFSSVLLATHGDREVSRFLLFSGLFTLWLMLDDFFMFHEFIFPYSLGIPQAAIIGAYIVLTVLYLLKFGRLLLNLEFTILIVAYAFFGVSLATDLLVAQSDTQFLIEDGAKLFGIATWFLFFVRTCYSRIRQLMIIPADI